MVIITAYDYPFLIHSILLSPLAFITFFCCTISRYAGSNRLKNTRKFRKDRTQMSSWLLAVFSSAHHCTISSTIWAYCGPTNLCIFSHNMFFVFRSQDINSDLLQSCKSGGAAAFAFPPGIFQSISTTMIWRWINYFGKHFCLLDL